jgi:hypothetical protein
MVDSLSGNQAKRVALAEQDRKQRLGDLVKIGHIAAPALF